MLSLLKLIRFPNLMIIAMTQCILRYFVISPMLQLNGFQLQMREWHFLLLVLSTMLIAAAGYMINDYFDENVDLINKPEKTIVGKKISKNTVYNLYYVFNFLAVLMGFYISYRVDVEGTGVVFILIPGLLWFYSTTYKNQFIIGNLIVAFLASLVPLIAGVFELLALNKVYQSVLEQYGINFNYVLHWVLGYSFFAFIVTLNREIIKDAEDFEGAVLTGRYSIPAAIGITGTKAVLIGLLGFIVFCLAFVYYSYIKDSLTFWYLNVCILLPIILTGYYIIKATSVEEFHRASMLNKLVMITGILYGILVKYIIQKM